MTPVERSLATALRWTLAGAAAAGPLLLITVDDGVAGWSVVHLVALVAFEVALALVLARTADAPGWFEGFNPFRSSLAAGVALTALVTGATALVTLATSAALRFDPSMQFLQLLSALDIAWVVTAAAIGARRRWGPRAGTIAALAVATFCVWSIWRYLDEVGVGPNGEWVVDGGELMRLVIPNDMAAAVVAVTLLLRGTSYRTEQARLQS